MIISVDGRFLDFDADIEIEKQIKLFDDISSIDGDYSYSFTIPSTDANKDILGITSINDTPYWNERINCQILTNQGEIIAIGFLRIELNTPNEIEASFYSGNSDWFQLFENNVREYNLTFYNKNQTDSEIVNSWTLSNGIVFPFVNRGGLLTRKSPDYYTLDFQPFIYVKDAVKTILSQQGVKLAGDLLKDPIYNSLITGNNGLSGIQNRIDAQTVYIGKSSNQSITVDTETKITFTDTSSPYSQSTENNWDTTNSQYIFTENCTKFNVNYSIKIAAALTISTKLSFRIYLNSTLVHRDTRSVSTNNQQTVSLNINSDDFNQAIISGAAVGDTLEIRLRWTELTSSGTNTILSGSWIKVKPIKFYLIYATSLLPDLKANEFLASIFKLFNGFCSYNSITKTLTVNKLDNIVRAEPIDLSDYVEINTIDYSEFIDSYSRSNILSYESQDFDELNQYNIYASVPYGSGSIDVNNDFIEEENNLIELDFIAAWQQDVNFLASLPRFEYVEMVETDEQKTITSVTDNGDGTARFNFSGTNNFSGGLVRVKDSTVDEYNGDYEILVNAASYVILRGVLFDGDATAIIIELDWQDNDNEDQALLIHVPSLNLSDIGMGDLIYSPVSSHSTIGLAYFYYPDNGTNLGNQKKGCLSFGDPEGSNQKGLISNYYQSAVNILNNGIKCIVTAYLPEKVYRDIDFLRPARINTAEFNGLFLINRITGYKGSHLPCEVELIKLS